MTGGQHQKSQSASPALAASFRQEPIRLQHLAVSDEHGLRWMSGRKHPQGVEAVELYAMPDYGRAPSALYAASPAQHPDDEAVDRFAAELKAKLADARAKGRGGWQDKTQVSAQALSDMLLAHVFKGDPRDVANFAMFLHQRGERITPSAPGFTPTPPEAAVAELYYLQDSRSYVGNCPMWWKKDGNGYTTRLDDAERFTLEDAMGQHRARPTDVPWPCHQIDALRRPTVDIQHMGSVSAQVERMAAIQKQAPA